MIALVNAARAQHGLQPVAAAAPLGQAARAHSTDMGQRGYFGHGGRGTSFMQRILRQPRTAGFNCFGETIAYGAGSGAAPAAIVRQWMASPPHRATLLDPRFRRIGVGIWRGNFDGMPAAALYTADFAG